MIVGILSIVRTAPAQNWNKSLTHIEHRAGAVSWKFGEVNSSPHSGIFASVSVDYTPRSCFLTFARVRYPVYTAPKYAARGSFSPLQKSRRNHRSYVRTVLYPV